ncbi:MAG: hypothetical protein U9R19_05710 [Bacteroidota bacterium]|nr:hypothetical protein [Bacteroidota bacterium]
MRGRKSEKASGRRSKKPQRGVIISCIEQWEEREFEASYGKVVEEYEISNILPGARE